MKRLLAIALALAFAGSISTGIGHAAGVARITYTPDGQTMLNGHLYKNPLNTRVMKSYMLDGKHVYGSPHFKMSAAIAAAIRRARTQAALNMAVGGFSYNAATGRLIAEAKKKRALSNQSGPVCSVATLLGGGGPNCFQVVPYGDGSPESEPFDTKKAATVWVAHTGTPCGQGIVVPSGSISPQPEQPDAVCFGVEAFSNLAPVLETGGGDTTDPHGAAGLLMSLVSSSNNLATAIANITGFNGLVIDVVGFDMRSTDHCGESPYFLQIDPAGNAYVYVCEDMIITGQSPGFTRLRILTATNTESIPSLPIYTASLQLLFGDGTDYLGTSHDLDVHSPFAHPPSYCGDAVYCGYDASGRVILSNISVNDQLRSHPWLNPFTRRYATGGDNDRGTGYPYP